MVHMIHTVNILYLTHRDGDWKLIQGSPGTYNGWYPVPGVDKDAGDEDHSQPGPEDFQLFNIKGMLTLYKKYWGCLLYTSDAADDC